MDSSIVNGRQGDWNHLEFLGKRFAHDFGWLKQRWGSSILKLFKLEPNCFHSPSQASVTPVDGKVRLGSGDFSEETPT